MNSLLPSSSPPRAHLYVLFEGGRGDRRPVSARVRAPRTGIKVRVSLELAALEAESVFLLYRRGDGDLVIGASLERESLEVLRGTLGRSAAAYEIAAVPVVAAPPVS